MYLYGNTMIPMVGDGFLYHFTSANSLMLILQEMRLKLSNFSNLNDLNETDLCCEWSDGGFDAIRIKQYIIEHCKLISFTQNYYEGEPRLSSAQLGGNHARMWAQYAANNSGACIVINEQKFIEDNKSILKNSFYRFDNVEYSRNLYDEKICTTSIPSEFVKDNYKHIFFKKHIDWGREHERRFFGIDMPEYLSILNSVEFIYLGQYFITNKSSMRTLIETLISPLSKCSKILTPHDFVVQANRDGRCIPITFAHGIIDGVKIMRQDSDSYIRNLNARGYDIDVEKNPMMRYF